MPMAGRLARLFIGIVKIYAELRIGNMNISLILVIFIINFIAKV